MFIVEDEPTVSVLIEMLAVELGWQVTGVASSEAEALDLLELANPSIAVLDVDLGTTSSLGVAAVCRARGIAVLFITGLTAQDVPQECGDDAVLAKPFSEEEFEVALRRCRLSTRAA